MKISVLMPVYNEEKYIVEAIESLSEQAGIDLLEVIAIDDFSSDATYTMLTSLQNRFSFLKVLRNVKKGKNSAFNLAYAHSSGDLIALFAGDDVLPKNSLASRAEPLQGKQNELAVSLCKLEMFSEIKRFDGVVTPRAPEKGSLSGGTMMLTRRMAEECFPLPENLANEDAWIACHIRFRAQISTYHVPIVGLRYRIHHDNSLKRTAKFKEKSESLHKRLIVYGVFLERYRSELSGEAVEHLSRLAAVETLRYNQSSLSILLMGGLSLSEKARSIFHSNVFLYWIRIKLFSLFSGR